MIVFRHQPTFIRVMRLTNLRATDNLGKIFRCGGDEITGRWIWDGCYRNMTETDNWDGSDKRAIIGLLDNLNGIPYRPQNELLDQWEKIIGRTGSAA